MFSVGVKGIVVGMIIDGCNRVKGSDFRSKVAVGTAGQRSGRGLKDSLNRVGIIGIG